MSQAEGGPDQGVVGAPSKYKRTSSGLVVAMVVTLAVVVGYIGLRSVIFPAPEVERPSIDWQAQVRAAVAEEQLLAYAPRTLPSGWSATAAQYDLGPSWRLALLTDEEEFVGVYERLARPEELVAEHVDDNATRGEELRVGEETWQEWTDRDGDYALTRVVEEPAGIGAVLVVGTAPPTVVRDLAAVLVPGEQLG